MIVLGDMVEVVDCEHRTAPREEGVPFGYSIGTPAVRNGRIDLGRAKPISEATYLSWTRRAVPAPTDLIFSREAPMGEVGGVPRNSRLCLGQRTVLLRPRSSHIDRDFLLYSLMAPQTQTWIHTNSAGSTVLHLNVADVRRIPIAYLPELDEQRRVVEILEDHLSRLDAARNYLSASVRRLDAMVSAVLLSLIPDADSYPPTWQPAIVADAGRVELGRQRHPDWHSGSNMRPYLRVANVFEDRIDTRDVKEMHWPGDVFDRFKLHPGDVLLNEGQTPDLLGRPALYRGDPPEVAFTNTLLRFKASDKVMPEFALLVFRRHIRAGRFKRESRITTNIAHLSAARLKPIEFPIPPLSGQKAIVDTANAAFDAIARLRSEIDVATAKQAQLRRSLLTKAFNGGLVSL